jgi:osmoprotectant transport system substrate-binding protein
MKLQRHAAGAGLVLAALLAAGCGSDAPDGAGATTTAATTGTATSAAATFTFKPLDAGGPLTKAALQKGDVQVALLFSSDADIAVNNWIELGDDKKLQQIENLTPAIRTDKATAAVTKALDAVSAKLTTAELVGMNKTNSVDLGKPADIAKAWLTKNALLPYKGDKVDGSFTVGSTNFAEQEIVAELYAQTLESAGANVTKKFQLGAREVVAPALEKGDIDLYPEYLGSYINFLDKTATVPSDPAAAVATLNKLLETKKLKAATPAAAEDRNTFVVTKATADKYTLKNVSDLAKVKDAITLGGPPECPTRAFCLVGLKDTYGLKFNA